MPKGRAESLDPHRITLDQSEPTPVEEIGDVEDTEARRTDLPPGYPYDYFHFQSQIGLTKHGGGFNATKDLLALCGVRDGQHILDVGCGAGITTSYIAREYDCHVTGVDIFDEMVARAREQAERVGVADRTEFRVADALDLPFDDDTFDVTLCESVTAFSGDKPRSLREVVRVTKPGGYVGLNEGTFTEAPTPELVKYIGRMFGPVTEFLSPDAWVRLLEGAGLQDIVVQVRGLEVGDALSAIKPVGCRGLVRASARMVVVLLRDRSARQFAGRSTSVPARLLSTMKFGLYVGRK